ncbi:BREX-1 system adenine-specific DNA-methyltransferase PglX [Microcystis elabens FACHB-917]|nr:BREX-1 system adenine-specific DNA-methyltransferase PglX [Microcystis elabens FACHB-917]
MEKEQRNRLQKATQDARKLLEEEFRRQLLQTYDIDVDRVRWAEEAGAHLQAEQRLIREKLVAWIEHKEAQINDPKEALLLALREMAFTALNRFVALKLMEARELVRPCVSGGLESAGFLEFTAVAQGLLADQESSYRLYLETIFEDVSRELRALFDPRDPASLLWPKRTALLELLEILNRPELAELWIEDETLGWVYQYFNGDAERKKMREESSAPRNSRELAVRNQFFTPRYVVEFLTDNTLGRIWYEMRQGNTGLKDQCRYLVRRPKEVWLQPGEEPPAQPDADETLSQEELLRQPVYIPHRSLKDPREIRMLDPACGSMHFGIYAFDLYLDIYAEAWELAQELGEQSQQPEAFASFMNYTASFADKAAFLRETPRLILQHNIHGIDIDARATQIARLTLWLRAQRAWQAQKLPVADRPPINRCNVVCAEPMPGERELLIDFIDEQFPESERAVLQRLLEAVFEKMQLAGEAGSVLNIEEEIRDVIDSAQRDWTHSAIQQIEMFNESESEKNGATLGSSDADTPRAITDEFWGNIEERIYTALFAYAERAEDITGFQRRLFADDTAVGFAFVHLQRIRFDAIVMNPPFGECTKLTYLQSMPAQFGSSRQIASLFISRSIYQLAPGGMLGILAPRLLMFLDTLEAWRCHLLDSHSITLCADLGYGVLDAVVEPAAFVLSGKSLLSTFIRLLSAIDKKTALLSAIAAPAGNKDVIPLANDWNLVPGHRIAYWAPNRWLELFANVKLERFARVSKGLESGDDERFLRLSIEVPSSEIGLRWWRYPKGGDYQPAAGNDELVVDYSLGNFARRATDADLYGSAGVTYTKRTTSFLSFRALPKGCIFSPGGPGIIPTRDINPYLLLSYLNSRPIGALVELSVGSGDSAVRGSAARDYNTGIIRRLPYLINNLSAEKAMFVEHALMTRVHHVQKYQLSVDELSPAYVGFTSEEFRESLIASELNRLRSRLADACLVLEHDWECDKIWREILGFELADERLLEEEYAKHPFCCKRSNISFLKLASENIEPSFNADESADSERIGRQLMKRSHIVHPELEALCLQLDCKPKVVMESNEFQGMLANNALGFASSLVSFAVGCSLGRWDISYALGKRMPPKMPDPFAMLSLCPPGQLQNTQGRPARPEDLHDAYPIDIPWDGILVNDPQSLRDIQQKAREVIEFIWNANGRASASSIEQELCHILGFKSLRDYFSRPSLFFADHLKRYSKSRRQAPIYWQLSAGNGNYSAWLYYHRFTKDTLYRVLRDFVEPRIQKAEREQFELESQGVLSGGAASRLHDAQNLIQDLRLLKSELDLVAPLWNPNLNDGVIINHAILWRITPYAPWQKKCKECWDKLVKGDYDWAHLAFHLWPERVIPKCTTDRSLAIAHGLEERLWQETNNGNWLPRQLSDADLQALVAEHSNPAVKSALERFLAAPPPVAPTRTRASRSTRASGSSTPRRARGSAAVVDAEATRQVLLALTAAPSDGLAKTQIADLIGVEASALTAVVKQLKESGQIDQLGERRGARYVLSEQGRAAVASQAGEED